MKTSRPLDRRNFLKSAGGTLATASFGAAGASRSGAVDADPGRVVFPDTDSLYHGDGWESLNPGYWQINPLFPALRSGPTAGSGASLQKQIPSSPPPGVARGKTVMKLGSNNQFHKSKCSIVAE